MASWWSRRRWQRSKLVLCAVLLFAVSAVAQDQPDPAEMKRLYDDALVQLRAAQDRKNELGSENEKLKVRVEELEKQLAQANARTESLDSQIADYAERTYYLRAEHAALREFLQQYPMLLRRWELFLNQNILSPHSPLDLGDSDWPFTVEG